MSHIELHIIVTAEDAERLAAAGMPRIDIEPQRCGGCDAQVGEVHGADDLVFWLPCGLLLDGDSLALLCRRCMDPLDKALGNIYD